MFRHGTLIFIVISCSCGSFAAAADQASEARREIEGAYARLSAATRNKDLDAIRAVYAPEYRVLQPGDDDRGLAEVMAEAESVFAGIRDPNLLVEIDNLDFDASHATAMVRLTQSFVAAPLPLLTPSVKIETAQRDEWIKTGGEWRLRYSEVRLVKTWVDGKLALETQLEPPLTAEERAAVMRDLGVHALPFKTVLAGNGFADLAGLDGLIGDARIVALGEASHGTAEFFQMKHRLLEYLVEKKGFTVFAIEGNWPEAELADRYIKTGEGDAASALAAMYFWTWQTAEVRAMLDWMRDYNGSRGERPILSFSGFDMQYVPVAIKRVLDLSARSSDDDRDGVRRLYEGAEMLDDNSESKVPAEEKARLRDNAAQALQFVEARREGLIRASTPEQYRDGLQAARVVLQAMEMRAGSGSRDRSMADNVRWLVEERFPGEKIILWAHNGHMGTALHGGEKSQGAHLRDRYGDKLVVLGFASHHGEVRARRMTAGKIELGAPVALPLAPATKVSVEGLFAEAGMPRFILDLRSVPKEGALGRWLSRARPHRAIGSAYDPLQPVTSYAPTILPETYDGIIFIEQSTAAVALK
jgi:erythromycin esterase